MVKHSILVLSLFSANAFAAKVKAPAYLPGGTVYICSDENVKLTANLANQTSDRVAVITFDGLRKVYPEYEGKRHDFQFLVGNVRNSTLQIKKTAKSSSLVSLETDPDTANSQLAHQGEGVTVTKFNAILSVPDFKIAHATVSCLETKW